MMKRTIFPLALVLILVTVVLVAPVSAAGILTIDDVKINAVDGSTSPMLIIQDFPIDQWGNITINVSSLNEYVESGTFTVDNVWLTSWPVEWIWTYTVEDNTLTLNSSGDKSNIDDVVYLTLTGAQGNPWKSYTAGVKTVTLTAIRSDGFGDGTFNFVIQTGGLGVTTSDIITTSDGATSPVITIADAEITPADAITIDLTGMNDFVANGIFNETNVIISDTALNADWTGSVGGDPLTLTLTSTGLNTTVDETITVTFTGVTNPWVPDTGGSEYVFPLTAIRSDGLGEGTFYFDIITTPPVNPPLFVDFSATPRSGNAPLKVAFTDLSTGGPTEWNWDFGDDLNSTDQNPDHTYDYAGSYTVTLTAYSDKMGLARKTGYINVTNGAIKDADTQINGLTIINCGGPQKISVNTSILTNYILSSDKKTLEIQTPPESGFKNITFFGHGFSQVGNLITGHPTGVRLVSVELAPTTGFSNSIGKMSSFWYSIDLPSYPCNSKLSTKISEGAEPVSDNLLRRIALENGGAGVSATAFTVEISKTNFPPGAIAKVFFSLNSSWVSSLSDPGKLYIWRIADDKTYGQILPTNYLGTDPVNNIDYFEADSPLGFSTFGVSSFTNSNNPFQIIAFIGSNIINQGISGQSGQGSGSGTSVAANAEPGSPNSEMQGGGIVVPTPVAPSKAAPLSQPAMSTNVGMFGWLLAIIQDYPIILVGVVGAIVAVGYFGWWKRRL